MALTFPANPTNGQIYDQYVYDATAQTWRVYGSDTGITNVLATKANLSGGNTFSGNQVFNDKIQQPNIISFHAYGNAVGNQSIASGAVVPFQNTRYNVGNAYNPSTYTFTAPVSGMYLFWFEAFNNSGATFRVALKVNGSGRLGQGQAAAGNNYNQARSVKLVAGDYVQVIVGTGTATIYGAEDHTEFSGMLIG